MKMQKGLTLIELAVVLTIIGLVIGSLLIPLTTQIDVTNIQRTDVTLEQIKEALVNYATLYSRLPCPASDGNTGREDLNLCHQECNGGTNEIGLCLQGTPSEEGFLPWANLGVSQYDAWGNLLKYRVDINYVAGITKELLELVASNYSNNIVIQDNWGASEVVAVIVSDGKKGPQVATAVSELFIPAVSAATVCEQSKVCYTQGDYIYNTAVLKSVSTTELFHRLVTAGKLPRNTAAILTPLLYTIKPKEQTQIPLLGGYNGGNTIAPIAPITNNNDKWYSQ